MAVAIAYAGGATVSSGSTSDPVTYTAVATGTASADRISVACINTFGRAAITGVTINGVTATRATGGVGNTVTISDIWYAANPTGTTGNVVVTYGTSSALYGGCDVFAVTGADTAPTDTDNNGSASANSISISALTTPTDGGSIITANCAIEVTAITWTNATEEYDVNRDIRATGASKVTAGTPTITADGGDGTEYAIAGAAWTATVVAGQPAMRRFGGTPGMTPGPQFTARNW